MCQQQLRLKYKRRVYSAHTNGTPGVPSMDDREAVPLDPIPQTYIRPHYQDTESKQVYLTHRSKHGEAAKMRRQSKC